MRFELSPSTCLVKRRRLSSFDSMEAIDAKAKLTAMAERLGREIRVFETSVASSAPLKESGDDDFYEFTAEDYYRTMSTKKGDNVLKTRKLREAEQAARRARITKAVIRVRFPDNYTLEANFHPSETIQSLMDLLQKVVSQPDIPFYIYTTPPKKQVKDMSQDLYSAGFVPGAIVYFSYDGPKGDDSTEANSGPFLQDEVRSLIGLDLIPEAAMPVQSTPEPVEVRQSRDPQEVKSAEKKPAKPKWFKL